MKYTNHYIDAGNYSVLSHTEGTQGILKIRSVRAELLAGSKVLEPRSNASPLLVYPDGSRIHFGSTAYNYRSFSETAIATEKTDLFLKLLLATLSVNDNYRVHWTVPDKDKVDWQAIIEASNGKHTYYHNGEQVTVNLDLCEPEYEGVPAVRYARRRKWVASNGFTLVIDLGGGTVNALIVDSHFQVIDNVSFDRKGCIALATDIAASPLVKARCGDELELGYILDGIADGSHCYCGFEDKHWWDIFPGLLDAWYKRTMEQIRTRFKPHFPKVTGILFIGGCANLIQQKAQDNPMTKVFELPELANIHGLAKG